MLHHNLKSISIFCKIVFCVLFCRDNLYSQNSSSVNIKLLIQGIHAGGTTLASPLFTNDLSTNQEHSDSIDVILAQSNPPFTVLANTRALLLNNGMATAVFPNMTPGQNCYIIIKHRNSVETWSKNPVLISQVTYYNFTGIHQFPEVYGILESIGITGASSIGTVVSDGGSAVAARGFCWNTAPQPTVFLPTKTVDGSGIGSFLSNITGLNPGTTYYIRPYATNDVGTAYGNEISFTIPTLPNVSTTAVSNVSNTSAVSGGTVNSDGGSPITARGVCWSMLPNPTISLSTKTVDGNGTGAFISNITSLGLGNTYFVRAYATNAEGTSYGEELQFTTSNVPSGPCPSGIGSVTDIDGNYYPVVTIGNQCWMRENLRTTKYRNGSNIPTNLNETDWATTSNGAYVDYSGNLANSIILGKLYNGYAVSDPAGLCPVGWHVPSDAEWQTLEAFLGMPANELNYLDSLRGEAQNVGGKMKTVNNPLNPTIFDWVLPNVGATNSSFFFGYAGSQVGHGVNPLDPFAAAEASCCIGSYGYWWSSTILIEPLYGQDYNFCRVLSYEFSSVFRRRFDSNSGFSVRCVRD